MKKDIKVAYIVPIYNVNRYLYDCLNSLKSISTKKEIILVDDFGNENPDEIVKKFIDDKSFKYLKNNKNMGAGVSRNIGLRAISADVTHVYFVDGDDQVIPQNIDAEFRKLNLYQSRIRGEFLYESKIKVKSAKKWNFVFKDGKKINEIPYAVWGSFWSVNVCEANFNDEIWEDQPWILNNIEKVLYKSSFCELPTYIYRLRNSSISNSKTTTRKIESLHRLILLQQKYVFENKRKKIRREEENIYKFYFSLPKEKRTQIVQKTVKSHKISPIKLALILMQVHIFQSKHKQNKNYFE